jgi:hypothetical protein
MSEKKTDWVQYRKQYQRRHIRFRKMNFNLEKPDDVKMLEWLDAQPEGVSNYLKRLVAADAHLTRKV